MSLVGPVRAVALVFCLLTGLTASAMAAEPVDEARALVAEGAKLLKKAERTRKAKKRSKLLADGLGKYSGAYLIITSRSLQNDAPDLLKQIGDQLARTNAQPEVAKLRADLLAKVISASAEGKMDVAYEALTSLRDLDPRDPTVDYALTVVGIRMEDQ